MSPENLKDAGFEDRTLMKAVAAKHPHMDLTRSAFTRPLAGECRRCRIVPSEFTKSLSPIGRYDNCMDKAS